MGRSDRASPTPAPNSGTLSPPARIAGAAAVAIAASIGLFAVVAAPNPAARHAGDATVLIDLNTATPEALELLPGIGPALAQRIIQDRLTRGPFRGVDDLDRVPGIGPKTLAELRPLVVARPPDAPP